MREHEFRSFLDGFHYSADQVEALVSGATLLAEYLENDRGPTAIDYAHAGEIAGFVEHLAESGSLERSNLVGPYFYAKLVGNLDLELGLLELLDGSEILGNLRTAIASELGEVEAEAIFAGVELPRLGSTPREWTEVNAVVFTRLVERADRETVVRILRSGLRNLPDQLYHEDKERYEAIGDLNNFLLDRGRRHYAQLQEHRDAGTPYFNQLITDDVLDYITEQPEIGRGVREGSTVIEMKIPHQSVEFLATDDLAAKQYHACHCPVVKESLAPNGPAVSDTFCEFCPSFNARPWEVIFGRKLDYEVLESAKRGAPWCRFAIHLPAEELEPPGRAGAGG